MATLHAGLFYSAICLVSIEPFFADGNYVCNGYQLSLHCTQGSVLVVESASYGSTPGERTCGAKHPAGQDCEFIYVDDVLNTYCFGRNICDVDVTYQSFDSICQDENNYLEIRRVYCIPAESGHRLCEGTDITANRGYIFGYAHHNNTCEVVFTKNPTDRVALHFISYYLSETFHMLCDNTLYISTEMFAEMNGEHCSLRAVNFQRHISIKSHRIMKLIVEGEALATGFGFLLQYEVTRGNMATLPAPQTVVPTEQSFLETASPADRNGTTVTLFHPGITRFAVKDAEPPGDGISDKDHKVIIIVICVIVFLAVITTSIVVIFVVKKVRKNVKHKGDVNNAVRSLAYRPSLEGNRYGTLPVPNPEISRDGITAPQVNNNNYATVTNNHNDAQPIRVVVMENEFCDSTGSEVQSPVENIETAVIPNTDLDSQSSPYINEQFHQAPPIDRSTRPDRIQPSEAEVPDSPPPPYESNYPNMVIDEVDGNMQLNNIIAALVLSDAAASSAYPGVNPAFS